MFLILPILAYDDDTDDWTKEETIDVNPMKIVAIEKSYIKGCSTIFLDGGIEYTVRLTRAQIRTRVNRWLKDNVLAKIYKDIKDQSN